VIRIWHPGGERTARRADDLEGETLNPKAYKGEGFRISTTVRDRVLNDKPPFCAMRPDEAFSGREHRGKGSTP
jgi:hypothetical protein